MPKVKKTELLPFDPAEYLGDEETIAIFLAEALTAGDADYYQVALETADRARRLRGIPTPPADH